MPNKPTTVSKEYLTPSYCKHPKKRNGNNRITLTTKHGAVHCGKLNKSLVNFSPLFWVKKINDRIEREKEDRGSNGFVLSRKMLSQKQQKKNKQKLQTKNNNKKKPADRNLVSRFSNSPTQNSYSQ